MKRTAKYVGLDVHQATAVASVRDPGGRVIAHGILHTEEREVVGFLRGLRGRVSVALEEGTQAQVAARRPGARRGPGRRLRPARQEASG